MVLMAGVLLVVELLIAGGTEVSGIDRSGIEKHLIAAGIDHSYWNRQCSKELL